MVIEMPAPMKLIFLWGRYIINKKNKSIAIQLNNILDTIVYVSCSYSVSIISNSYLRMNYFSKRRRLYS